MENIEIDKSFLAKCQYDSYHYFALIRNFGWISFTEATKVSDERLKLKCVSFLDGNVPQGELIRASAADLDRGVEIQISDIVFLIDCTS